MPFVRSLRSHPAALLLAVALLAIRVAAAATPVYADPAASCAGLTPCFATVQVAVNNAGPSAAEIGLFPGTYAESVDLDQMGSAIGGTPGSISIQALNASGQPATNGVAIDPAAPGGPGIGPALSGGLANAPIPGSIGLRGLTATSPDTTAVFIFADGNLLLEDVQVHDAGSAGLVIGVTGTATVARVSARLNADGGLTIFGLGTLTATDVSAERNGLVGIELAAEQVDASGVHASLNGEDGISALGCTRLQMHDVQVEQNTDNGLEALAGASLCSSPLTQLRNGLSFDVPALTAIPGSLPTFVTGSSASMQLAQIKANHNGNVGIGAVATEGTASLTQLSASDNQGGGVIAHAPELHLADAHASGNLYGMAVIATQAELSHVSADDSVAGSNPPAEGSGIAITALEASLSQVQARNNAFAGLLLAWLNTSSQIAHYSVADGFFEGNDQGVAAISDGLMDVDMNALSSINNLAAGINLPVLNRATITDVTANGSPIGMALNVSQRLAVDTAELAANDTGAVVILQPGADARVSCSNIHDNPTVGLQLLQGAALDARFNFWGDASGPTHPGNPGGGGDGVGDAATGDAGQVDYSSFLSQPATADDCPRLALPAYVAVPAMDWRSRVLLALLLLAAGWWVLRRALAARH